MTWVSRRWMSGDLRCAVPATVPRVTCKSERLALERLAAACLDEGRAGHGLVAYRVMSEEGVTLELASVQMRHSRLGLRFVVCDLVRIECDAAGKFHSVAGAVWEPPTAGTYRDHHAAILSDLLERSETCNRQGWTFEAFPVRRALLECPGFRDLEAAYRGSTSRVLVAP